MADIGAGWVLLGLALLGNGGLAWWAGRTWGARLLGWLICSLVLAALLGGALGLRAGLERLGAEINPELARQVPAAVGAFWLLVLLGVALRLRRSEL